MCLPAIEAKQMVFYTWKTTEALVKAPFDTWVPDAGANTIVMPDVLLVPLLAFDLDCY